MHRFFPCLLTKIIKSNNISNICDPNPDPSFLEGRTRIQSSWSRIRNSDCRSHRLMDGRDYLVLPTHIPVKLYYLSVQECDSCLQGFANWLFFLNTRSFFVLICTMRLWRNTFFIPLKLYLLVSVTVNLLSTLVSRRLNKNLTKY